MADHEPSRELPPEKGPPITLTPPVPEEQQRIEQVKEAMRKGIPLHKIEEILDAEENS